MATSLPPNPVTGDQYTGPFGSLYRYDGFKWTPVAKTAATTQYLPLSGGVMTGEIQFVVPQDVDGSVY
jgi:hypothetical protein